MTPNLTSRRPRSRTLALALALALAPAGGAAFAQSAPPVASKEAIAESQALYDEGRRLYNLGDFEQALERFEAAYGRFQAPEFLFNIGQCYRNLRRWEKAIFVFESFLREKPDARSRPVVEEFLVEMRGELERERAAAAAREAQESAQQAEAAAQARRQREAELAVLEKRQQLEADALERQRLARVEVVSRPDPVWRRWWFWTVLGGVAAGAVGGLVVASSGTDLPGGTLGTIDGR